MYYQYIHKIYYERIVCTHIVSHIFNFHVRDGNII